MFRTYKDTVRVPVTNMNTNKDNTKSESDDISLKKEYFCEFCNPDSEYRTWSLETDAEIHRRQYHKKEILNILADPDKFMCSICLHGQPDKATLIQHIKSHHLLSPPNAVRVKRELFICDYCDKVFFNKELLSVHIQTLHLLSVQQRKFKTTRCPACNVDVSVKSVWFHFLAHGIIYTTSCPICMKTLDSSHEVLKHTESHAGFYNCRICIYETKKEPLFLSHIEKHKKTVDLEGKDIKNISRYFVPNKELVCWTGKFLNVIKGIKLASEIKICILCQTMCVTEQEMLEHIYGDHAPGDVVEVKRYLCACGEEFFKNILLKHHVFTLKGDHKIFNGTKEELIANKIIQELTANSSNNCSVMKTLEIETKVASEQNTPGSQTSITSQSSNDIEKMTCDTSHDRHDIKCDARINSNISNVQEINNDKGNYTYEIEFDASSDTPKSNNDTGFDEMNCDEDNSTEKISEKESRQITMENRIDTTEIFEPGNQTNKMDGVTENTDYDESEISNENSKKKRRKILRNLNTSVEYHDQLVIVEDSEMSDGMESTTQIQYIPESPQEMVYSVLEEECQIDDTKKS